jgi:hypothetical protein
VGNFRPFSQLSGSTILGSSGQGDGNHRLAADTQTPGQAEVGDVRLALGIQQDVAGFELAVQQLPLVGMMDRSRHRYHQCRQRAEITAEATQVLVQSPPLRPASC